MTLDEWLISTGMTERECGRRIGRAQATVNRYRQHKQLPRKPDIIKLYRLSEGAVQPNDFYDLPVLHQHQAAACA